MLDTIREDVFHLLLELPRNHLVSWTSGNISARDVESGLIVIKPSGVPYDELSPEKLVIVNMNGEVVEGQLKPSSDLSSHIYIYNKKPEINGIVHTHSPYASAFAASGKSLPVFITEAAEEFGGPVPCTDFTLIGDDSMGKQVIKYMGKCPAVLLKQHGVITTGSCARKAVELAVLLENCARITLYSILLGEPQEIDAKSISELYYRQNYIYGQ